MAITDLDHINIRTSILEETKDFYVDVLGLEVGDRPPFREFGYWLYSGGHPTVHLSYSEPDSARRTNPEGMGDGLDHVALYGEGLDDMLASLERHGIDYEKRLAANNRVVQVFFLDPNGVRIELGFNVEVEGVNVEEFDGVSV